MNIRVVIVVCLLHSFCRMLGQDVSLAEHSQLFVLLSENIIRRDQVRLLQEPVQMSLLDWSLFIEKSNLILDSSVGICNLFRDLV